MKFKKKINNKIKNKTNNDDYITVKIILLHYFL